MIGLTKSLYFLVQNERKIKVHRLKIPEIIKLLKKNKELKKDDIDNINIQIINNINYIDPQKIIRNICNNIRIKEDLKSLKKKIYFNHLLLRTIINNKNLQLYEFKEDEYNKKNENLIKTNENVRKIYGRNKRNINKKITINTNYEKKELESKSNLDIYNSNEMNNENFKLFDLTNNYNSFVLDNILKNICSYIYNFKVLNSLNQKEKNGYEMISVLLISNIFNNFFHLKYGYKYIVHFLNGLNLYKIKKEVNIKNLNFKLISDYLTNFKEKNIFEKEYNISFVIDYLSKYERKDDYLHNKKNNIDENNYIQKYQDENKKTTYIVNTKENILLSYNLNESFLNYFLNIIINKYNVEKMSFTNYCSLMHLYSISNHFVIDFFTSFPVLFLKNKMYMNINIIIILLNSCIFFLKDKSFLTNFHSFHIHINSDEIKKLNEENNTLDILKEKIYSLTEQIINYLEINKEIMNINHLLQVLEILSYIKYNKTLFSYIFNQINNSLCLLDKYQIFYFLNSLSNYDIIYNETKNNIYNQTIKNIDHYSFYEIKQLEKHLQIKY
ncbi:conserved Plasmodium protein, unknown function [Plasmodium gallinaceum]|uniref:Uncharacterized protein n=1 Tax=Plasmodium gallinaceum TaxID=5849 RepID=A0A1J1GZE2_PLAGA|nr:conserved Plasmodium protein, unknown function [Plasmodium gallinaceum]CRG96387.1 conserved Plasmodium protein, unknown function [Plasmodium gallinaceum]